MNIVIGLGNPGTKYKGHRHNIGTMVLDALAAKRALHFESKPLFHAEIAVSGTTLTIVKPETFMNDSGTAARMVAKQYNAPVTVVYDDIDIALGTVKCSYDRGAGGHNGVQSIIDHLGTKEFFRIRVGVRPVHEELLPRIAPPDGFQKFLLSDFAPFEVELKEQGIVKAIDIIEMLSTKSIEEIMTLVN